MTIRGVYRNGQVVLDEPPPADWPEGLAIRVEPDSKFSATTEADPGDDPGDDPESIARWLAWFDSLEPMILTPADDAAMQAAHSELKRHEFATRADRDRKIDGTVP